MGAHHPQDMGNGRSCLPDPVHRQCFPVKPTQPAGAAVSKFSKDSPPPYKFDDNTNEKVEEECRQQRERFNSCFSSIDALNAVGDDQACAEENGQEEMEEQRAERQAQVADFMKELHNSKWKLISRSDNFESVLEKMGIAWVLRKLVKAMTGQVYGYQVVVNGDESELLRKDIGGRFTADKDFRYKFDGHKTKHPESLPGIGDMEISGAFGPHCMEWTFIFEEKAKTWSQFKTFVMTKDKQKLIATARMLPLERGLTFTEEYHRC